MIARVFRDSRVQIALVLLLSIAVVLALIATRYGETGIEDVDGARQVRTDGERCAIVLPDGWSWRAASWTAVSRSGTILGFSEQLLGRPQYPDWEEVSESMIARNVDRAGAEIDAEADTVRIDFGAEGGLSVLQRFDRVGCLLTFSGGSGARAEESAVWEEIIASLKRTSPTDTPVEVPPWNLVPTEVEGTE